MSEPTPARPLSPAEAREIDQICDRFEAACKAGERPNVDSYLGSSAEPMPKRASVPRASWKFIPRRPVAA